MGFSKYRNYSAAMALRFIKPGGNMLYCVIEGKYHHSSLPVLCMNDFTIKEVVLEIMGLKSFLLQFTITDAP